MRYEDRWTRLELLKRGGATAFALGGGSALLAACGSSDKTSSVTSGGGGSSTVGQLDFLWWEGYDLPDKSVPAMQAWKAQNGATLKTSYIAANEDIPAKIQGGGGGGLDIIGYGAQNSALYKELGFLEPLDPDKLPNLKNLIPLFASDKENFWLEPDGTRLGVPFSWGVLAVNYDSALIKAPTSYDVLFEPEYKGKVAVTDSVHDVLGLVAAILGFKYGAMTPDQFQQVTDYTKRVLGQTKGLSQSFGDAAGRIASGEAVFAFPGYGGMNSYAAAAGKKTVKLAVPKEGSYFYCDAIAIPKASDNIDGAHAFINATLDPKVQAQESDYLFAGTVCTDSVPLLSKDVKALFPYDDLDPYFAKSTFQVNPPTKSDQYVTLAQATDAWQKLKSEA
jgi:spermidine/putrescine transport system substrate-binding protein